LVDSDPLIFRTDNSDHKTDARTGIETVTPILRLRGGVGEEEKEEHSTEETVDGFILTALDEDKSEPVGGRIGKTTRHDTYIRIQSERHQGIPIEEPHTTCHGSTSR
jgi:hypothetical protein